MKVMRWTSASLAVVVAALLLASAAFAQSTDVYPAGDAVAASSSPVQGGSADFNCPVNPGSFTLPAKGNPSGSVTTNFTTRPSFECKAGFKVETSGTWSITIQYGTGAAVINIPAEGLHAYVGSVLSISNNMNEWSWNGVWNNGFSSPVSVSSSLDLLPTENTYFSGGVKKTGVTLGSAFSTLTDTIHPASLLLLGP